MKNFNEFRLFFRKGINETKDVINQGAKSISAILSKVIVLIEPGRDAFEDAKEIPSELGVASNSDMDASDQLVANLFSNFNEEDRRDYDAIEKGIVAVVRKISRERAEGIAEGKAIVLNALAEAGVTQEDLIAKGVNVTIFEKK